MLSWLCSRGGGGGGEGGGEGGRREGGRREGGREGREMSVKQSHLRYMYTIGKYIMVFGHR